MAEISNSLKQNRVRAYIMSQLLPACGKEPMPVKEQRIARLLGFNRETVRAACLPMLRDRTLIKIGNRPGLFINPDHARMCGKYIFTGILGPNPTQGILDTGSFNLTSFFSVEMGDQSGDYQILKLNGSTMEEMLEELLSYPLNLLLWIAPEEPFHPLIDELIKRGKKIIVFASPSREDWKAPSSNSLLYDFKLDGIAQADFMIQKHCKRPGYLSCYNINAFPSFCQRIKEHNGECSMEHYLPLENGYLSKLKKLLKNNAIDSLFFGGKFVGDFRETLELLPELGKLPIFTDDSPKARLLQADYEHINFNLLPHHYFYKHEYGGRMGACVFRKYLSGDNNKFENFFLDFRQSTLEKFREEYK